MAALAEMRNDPQRGPIVQSALRSRQSPPNARQAWTMYLTATTSQPTTRALRNGMAMSVDPRDEWLGSVIGSADAGLRDEIAAAIPTTRPSDRPALRRAVREITRRLAPPTTQP